jgi:predicted tellurium resistance membrane protein TerC
MEWLASPQVWASLLTLSALEIVLGIDNLIFLSILAARLPPAQQARARQVGLVLALAMRLGLLATISWIMGLTAPVLAVAGHDFSWRDLILIGGGLFLVYKGTQEIHARIEGEDEHGAGSLRDTRASRAPSSRSACSTSSFRWTASSPPWGWPTSFRS